MESEEPLLKVEGLKIYFESKTGLLEKTRYVKAVDGVTFQISRGKTLGLVGESGCGKTTTARAIVRLAKPASGKILFKGRDISSLAGGELKRYRRDVQYIFQDPYESLNPRQTVFNAIATPIRIHNLASDRRQLSGMVEKLLRDVNLDPSIAKNKYPHQLSGGQRQRVNIARALATKPELIIADEPVSMLDVSLRLGILKLMERLEEIYGVTFIIITHDIAVAKHVCNSIAVMYLGRIVEIGNTSDVIDAPIHPYTRLLVKATPKMIRSGKPGLKMMSPREADSAISSALNLPTGCRFHPRCEYMIERCKTFEPVLLNRRNGQLAACDVVSV